MDVGVGDEVVVVDHEDDLAVGGDEFVHDRAHDGVESVALSRTHRFGQVRDRFLQSCGDVGPEARRVVVALVDLQPAGRR